MKTRAFLSLFLLTTVSLEAAAQCTTGQVTDAGTTETAQVRFSALTSAQSVSVGGLTLSASATCTPNAPQTAGFFASLANGSGGPALTGVYAGCTKSGTLSGWSTGAVFSGQNVLFTSSTPNANVPDISVTGTFTSVTITQGTFSLSSLLTLSLVCGRPAAAYPGAAGDRWQEQHRAGGQLWDYKLGIGNPVDPESQVGTYSFSGTGATTAVTHTYSATAFTWRVYLFSAPNTYSFCTAAGAEHVRAFVIAGAGTSGNGCASFPP